MCGVGEKAVNRTACEPCALAEYQHPTDGQACQACPSGQTTLNTKSLQATDCLRE